MDESMSNCCGAGIYAADSEGFGKCTDCHENCCPIEPEEDEMTCGAMDRF
jgi:hypothetical protein